MKKIKTVLCVYFLILINTSGVFAFGTTTPEAMPTPNANGTVTTNADETDPPPGGPIDDNLLFLTISALILGSVVIYKNKIKKASV